MASTEAWLDRKKFLELQYNTLRKEIDDGRALHTKITTGALVIGPVLPILAKATEYLSSKGTEAFSPNSTGVWVVLVPRVLPLLLFMLSPLIVLSLYIQFVSEHHAIGRCAKYIREYIETEIDPKDRSWVGWETWLKRQNRTRERYQERGFYLLYGSLYVITTCFAAAYAAITVGLWIDLGV